MRLVEEYNRRKTKLSSIVFLHQSHLILYLYYFKYCNRLLVWYRAHGASRDCQRREVMNENKNNDKRDKSDDSYTVLIFDWMIVFSLNSKRQASFNAFGRRSFAERRSNEMRYCKWSFHFFIFQFFIYFSLFWNRNRAWVIHSYSFLALFLPPKFVFWKYFIVFISSLYYFRTENLISLSIISFLTVFLQNLYFCWPSFYRKVIEII